MSFTKLLDNKNVLFIPIYSARSYDTGQYQLQNDGNFARVYSTIKSLPLKSATVLIPLATKVQTAEESAIEYVEACYGINAAATRKYMNINDIPTPIVKKIKQNKFDYVVCEPNCLTFSLQDICKDKLIYWCVASATSIGTPWFVEDYKAIDECIAKSTKTAVANEAQREHLGGKSFVEESFYNPEIFAFESIYFPFRLTDRNYHAEEFVAIINELAKDKSLKKFKVFYPDLNDCGNFDDLDKNIFVKVPKQHELYIQLLKSKPIIPYLENADMLEHISIHEFLYYGVELIMLKSVMPKMRYKQFKNDIKVLDDIADLKELLREKLRRTI